MKVYDTIVTDSPDSLKPNQARMEDSPTGQISKLVEMRVHRNPGEADLQMEPIFTSSEKHEKIVWFVTIMLLIQSVTFNLSIQRTADARHILTFGFFVQSRRKFVWKTVPGYKMKPI